MKQSQRGFSFVEMLIVIAIMAIILIAGIPYYQQGVRNARETAAIRTIHTLHAAELQYYSQYARYAVSLEELGPPRGGPPGPNAAKLISADLASGQKGGYRFRLTVEPEGYAVHAEPVKFGSDGSRTFYSDQTMVVQENRGPEPATANSPETR